MLESDTRRTTGRRECPPASGRDSSPGPRWRCARNAGNAVLCLAPQVALEPTTLRLVNSRAEEDGSNVKVLDAALSRAELSGWPAHRLSE
jgi:hypothetical protein